MYHRQVYLNTRNGIRYEIKGETLAMIRVTLDYEGITLANNWILISNQPNKA
jgi:hypothetical protein